MSKWLDRARLEIPQTPPRPTAVSDVRSPERCESSLTSLLAVSPEDPFAGTPTLRDEIAAQLVRVLPGADHPDYSEALALTLADPEGALATLRATTAPRPA